MAPIPPLPVHLIDGILTLAALPSPSIGRPSSAQLFHILQVLPPSLLRSTFCSAIRTANNVISGPSELSNERPNLTFEPLFLNNISEPGLLELYIDIFVPMLKREERICTAFVYQLCLFGRLDLLQRLHAGLVKHQQPGSVRLRDLVNGLAGAVAGGCIEVLKWWHEQDAIPMALVAPMLCRSASKSGHAQLLEWLLQVDEEFEERMYIWEIEQCVLDALIGEHIQVLEWWLRLANAESQIFDEFPLPVDTWTRLCRKGKLKSLQWLTTNSVPINQLHNPTHDCIDLASRHGHTDILQWWLTARTDFNYTPDAMDDASSNGHLDTLQWWKSSGQTLSFTPRGRQAALTSLHFEIVEWWDQLPLYSYLSGASDALPAGSDSFSSLATLIYTSFGRLDLLQKLSADELLLELESVFMNACHHGHLHILEAYKGHIQAKIDHGWSIWVLNGMSDIGAMWWCLRNVGPFFTKLDGEGSGFWNEQLKNAAKKGSIELVDWIVNNILKSVAVPLNVIAAACANEQIHVLELLLQRHGLRESVDAFASGDQIGPHPLVGGAAETVLEWWERNGLPKLPDETEMPEF